MEIVQMQITSKTYQTVPLPKELVKSLKDEAKRWDLSLNKYTAAALRTFMAGDRELAPRSRRETK